MHPPLSVARCLSVALLIAVSVPAAATSPSLPHWGSYGRDAQHSAVSTVASQPINRIRWQMAVDRKPQYSGDYLYIHYGSPLISAANTVIVPVKARAFGTYRVEGHRGSDGKRLWRRSSSYVSPPHDWVPSFSPVLSPTGTLWVPGKGGVVNSFNNIDSMRPSRATRNVFYGNDAYRLHRRDYTRNVFINTPLTADNNGTVYFGFQVTGPTSLNLTSGIARIAEGGGATWVGAATAAADPAITKVAHNSAPALSLDGTRLYVVVNQADGLSAAPGYLLELDSTTLAFINKVRLVDPLSGMDAQIHDDGTASPTVGPDGDVYIGVLENPYPSNHFRGWLLHFAASLAPKGFPGAFGWDDTASIVPAAMVPSYVGSSAYLVMTKYNNYAGVGDGVNRIAILDPNDSMLDPISGATVMKEVMTVAGPTPDQDHIAMFPNAVREWCINTAAVDSLGKAILVNNEDGKLYRWDTVTGLLSQSLVLTPGLGEAYTPTLIGPDGTVYAINNGTLFATGM